MKTPLLSIVLCALAFSVVGCKKDHFVPCCTPDAIVIFDYKDAQGKQMMVVPKIKTMIDMTTGQEVTPHAPWNGETMRFVGKDGEELQAIFGELFTPQCSDRTFSKVRSYVTMNIYDHWQGDVIGHFVDTVDVELRYNSVKECHVDKVSLNGTPGWTIDTCQSKNDTFFTRIVTAVVQEGKIERK